MHCHEKRVRLTSDGVYFVLSTSGATDDNYGIRWADYNRRAARDAG
jgi:hypothetical protein